MKHSIIPEGVCASRIEFDLDGDTVKNVRFTGGCNGNLKAISALVEGQSISALSSLLKGITCGFKSTSCSDQLIKALEIAYEKEKELNAR